jgi:hypothetical protein
MQKGLERMEMYRCTKKKTFVPPTPSLNSQACHRMQHAGGKGYKANVHPSNLEPLNNSLVVFNSSYLHHHDIQNFLSAP